MKKVIFTAILLLSLTAYSQKWKPIAARSSLMFVSGFADGTSEVLKVKYESFDRVMNLNDQWWDYNKSWTNKYSTYPKERFPLSTTALVWVTDGYHCMRMIRNCTMITAIVIPLNHGKKKPFKQYLFEGAIYYVSYTAGFNTAYNIIYK